MKQKNLYHIIMAVTISLNACTSQTAAQKSFLLRDNWAIQSSKDLREGGNVISTPAFHPEKWYTTSVPSTVFGTLIENKVFPDPYFGTNI
jgi:exo-1,4-beta-D-glucosaminidase